MARLMVLTLLLLLPALPAFGKARNDIYPVPCSQLWDAVTITLGNPGDYKIMTSDDSEMTASYTVTGAVRVRVNSVVLNQQDAGCEMNVKSPDAGYMVDDESTFRKRVGKALARLQAAKPSQPASTGR
jgi:hypothetical protein